MPNWTFNILDVEGPKADIKKFKETARGVSFYEIPGAPTRKTSVETIRTFKLYNPPPESEMSDFCFQKFIDYPDEVLAEGYNRAYEWEHKNYGVKWGANDPALTIDEGKYLQYEFNTPWSSPETFFDKVSKMYPKLTFCLTSEYEGEHEGCDEYKWTGGERQ